MVASILLALAGAQTPGFRVQSPDISAGSTIKSDFVFNSFGCAGQNPSPAWEWPGLPQVPRASTPTRPPEPAGSPT